MVYFSMLVLVLSHEALTEKMTWLGHSFADDPFDDPFGKLLKDKGSPNF